MSVLKSFGTIYYIFIILSNKMEQRKCILKIQERVDARFLSSTVNRKKSYVYGEDNLLLDAQLRIGASMRERASERAKSTSAKRVNSLLAPIQYHPIVEGALAKRAAADCGRPFASFSDSRPLAFRGNNSEMSARYCRLSEA